MARYRKITLCGSTRFKKEFEEMQKRLTLQGNIVISVGLFGHAGDIEVWEGMAEDKITDTKNMLDDMHKKKIDMADEIYVINPNGYIGESTWSEICYAYMTDKKISFMEPIDTLEIKRTVKKHIDEAERLAAQQYDVWTHLASDYPGDYLINTMVTIKYKGYTTMDPWVPKDENIPVSYDPYIGHADKSSGFDPFKVYGKRKMALFVETILQSFKNTENM